MAHPEQKEFCLSVKKRFPEKFKNANVLDIGSLDINGNNRYLFENCSYIGVDVGEGKNVDVVSLGHEYRSENNFDVVISTECLEHDPHWKKTFANMIRHCKRGALVIMTCATTGRPEHGTTRTNKWCSPLTEWDYYRNLTKEDFTSLIIGGLSFYMFWQEFYFDVNNKSHDLYFYGIVK